MDENRDRNGRASTWMALVAVAGLMGAACSAQPDEAMAPQPAGDAAGTDAFATAADLLSALETADRGLRRLAANVQYTKVFAIGGDTQIREGDLYFTSDPGTPGAHGAKGGDHRRFAVEFNKFFRGDRMETDRQSYAFDGQWLMEKHPDRKEFHLRQVVGPGESFDPLKIGEGPFPLPIGQKKDEILREYDATLLSSDDGLAVADPEELPQEEQDRANALIAFVNGAWQVRLTPRADAASESDFAEVRLWYIRDKSGRLLPRMARTVAATNDPDMPGDVSIVCLTNVAIDDQAKFQEDVFSVEPPKDWAGEIEEFEGPPGAPGASPPDRGR